MMTGRLGEGKIALTWRSPYMEQEGMGDKRGDSERAASVLQCYQGQLGRRRAEDTAVGMQLLIPAQIGLSVFNKGAKIPFKNPAGIWVQRFSHNREEYQV